MPRRTRVLLGLSIGVATVGAMAWYLPSSARTPRSLAVASVNGAILTKRDVDLRVSELVPMFSFHANMSPEKMRGLRRTALDELMLDELILQDARARGLEPDRKDVETQYAAIRGRFADEPEFDSALASSGISRRDFRRQLERAVLVREAREARALPDPADGEVRAYYDANPGRFLRPEQVRIVELLVRVDPAGGAGAAAAGETKARGLAARARKGDDLGALAREHSDDDWRVKDGDLGWVHRGRLDPDLEAAAFAAPVGEIRSARSLSGFHVFRVVARQPETQLSLEDARPIILERLRSQRREAADAAWHAELRRAATLEILDAELANATPLELPRLAAGARGKIRAGIAPGRSH
jgi:peptidyl-prolyl cis-trans isomerase C